MVNIVLLMEQTIDVSINSYPATNYTQYSVVMHQYLYLHVCRETELSYVCVAVIFGLNNCM